MAGADWPKSTLSKPAREWRIESITVPFRIKPGFWEKDAVFFEKTANRAGIRKTDPVPYSPGRTSTEADGGIKGWDGVGRSAAIRLSTP